MSWFGKSFAEHRADADAHFAAGRFGEAKLGYEKALDKQKEASAADVDAARERITECRARLAERLANEGEAFALEGDFERAAEAFGGALEVAPSDAHRETIRARADALQGAVARAALAEAPISADDQLAALSALWEEEQAEEYESYGDRFHEAYLALENGNPVAALGTLKDLLARHADAAPRPSYLLLELGRAQIGAGEPTAGAASIREFIGRLGPDEGGHARIVAHHELALAAIDAGEDATAEKELRAAVEFAPDDTEAVLECAAFLRSRKHAADALEILRRGADVMGSYQSDLRLVRELGLCAAEVGRTEEARQSLEFVIEQQARRFITDFDSAVVVPLAAIYEQEGDPRRAADLYRHLAKGSDKAGHYRYNLEAARLLRLAGDRSEARNHVLRAKELAQSDDQKKATDELLGSLG